MTLEKSNGERNLSKTLWRAVMSRIHEDLSNESFTKPSGLVTATVCSKSGKLPIAGICDQTLTTEYFTEGTVPTESCDVHYQGFVCMATGLPACDTCPYRVPGVVEIPPNDDGSSGITNLCPHTPEYYINNPGALISDTQSMQQNQQQIQQQQQTTPEQQQSAQQTEQPVNSPENDITTVIPTE